MKLHRLLIAFVMLFVAVPQVASQNSKPTTNAPRPYVDPDARNASLQRRLP